MSEKGHALVSDGEPARVLATTATDRYEAALNREYPFRHIPNVCPKCGNADLKVTCCGVLSRHECSCGWWSHRPSPSEK